METLQAARISRPGEVCCAPAHMGPFVTRRREQHPRPCRSSYASMVSTKGPDVERRRSPPDKATRRQEILQAARDTFAKHGYHAAKVEDIVNAAGVARGTFYLYFEDKRAICEEIVDRLLVRFGMAIQRVDVVGDVTDQVRANIRRIVHV